MVNWACEILEKNCFLLDIESTGLANYDELIDISIIDVQTQEVVFDSLFKPTTLINPHAQRVHGITYEMLRKAPFLEDYESQINSILENKTILTYNASFDSRIFKQSYDKYSMKNPRCFWDCLMVKCTQYFGKQLKLDKVCEILNVEKGTHRARTDALAAVKVIHALAKHEY